MSIYFISMARCLKWGRAYMWKKENISTMICLLFWQLNVEVTSGLFCVASVQIRVCVVFLASLYALLGCVYVCMLACLSCTCSLLLYSNEVAPSGLRGCCFWSHASMEGILCLLCASWENWDGRGSFCARVPDPSAGLSTFTPTCIFFSVNTVCPWACNSCGRLKQCM